MSMITIPEQIQTRLSRLLTWPAGGSRTGTFVAAYLSLVLGFIGLALASVEAGNMRCILLLASTITCGYNYQCPLFRLNYQGLGEPLCFAAFGPFATTAFYLMQSIPSEMIY